MSDPLSRTVYTSASRGTNRLDREPEDLPDPPQAAAPPVVHAAAMVGCCVRALLVAMGLASCSRPGARGQAGPRVEFPFPDEEDRVLLWDRLLGDAPRAADVDLAGLARRFVSGGHIKSAVLRAAFAAAAAAEPIAPARLATPPTRSSPPSASSPARDSLQAVLAECAVDAQETPA